MGFRVRVVHLGIGMMVLHAHAFSFEFLSEMIL